MATVQLLPNTPGSIETDYAQSSRGALLIYCILKADGNVPRKFPTGIDGRPVEIVEYGELGAVVSKIHSSRDTVLAPELAHLLAYERVVEAFHRQCPVLPMCYGSVLEDQARLLHLLRERGTTYCSLLREVGGCVEMRVHVLLTPEAKRRKRRLRRSPAESPVRPPGRAYLEVRKAQYADKDWAAESEAALVERLRDAFAGLYRKCVPGQPFPWLPAGPRNPLPRRRLEQKAPRLLPLDFLIRRESEEAFRKTFHRVSREESVKLLMSGPWPPYMFVFRRTEVNDEEP
jgi:hypothetical protein